MSIFYNPRPSQKTNLLIFLYFQLRVSITCFGFRPDHMVSDFKLTIKFCITKVRLASKFTFCENETFTFCHKSEVCSRKTKKVKNVHPLGVPSSPPLAP